MSRPSISHVLRQPGELARQCLQQRELRELALFSIAAIALCGAIFGATIGSSRGGVQVLYAAVKVPAACLLTLAVCAPAYYAFANVFGRAWSMRTVVGLTLSSIARASLALLATVPPLWFLIDTGAGYHATAFWAALAYGASGLAALGVLVRALGEGRHRLLVLALVVGMFGLVGGQTAWMLRPYLGRPSQASVPFLRAPDGVFAERVWTSGQSAAGVWEGEDEP
jgi:hypothetical protein